MENVTVVEGKPVLRAMRLTKATQSPCTASCKSHGPGEGYCSPSMRRWPLGSWRQLPASLAAGCWCCTYLCGHSVCTRWAVESWVCCSGPVLMRFSRDRQLCCHSPLLTAGRTHAHGLSSPELPKLLQTSLYIHLRASVGS